MPIRNFVTFLLLICGTMLLGACESKVPVFPAQTWEDLHIELESRPPQAEKGMNEFLVIVNRINQGPSHNLIIFLTLNDENGHWHQAIQDGHIGVYRRALPVEDPAHDVLLVRIQHDDREGILRFPLSAQAMPK